MAQRFNAGKVACFCCSPVSLLRCCWRRQRNRVAHQRNRQAGGCFGAGERSRFARRGIFGITVKAGKRSSDPGEEEPGGHCQCSDGSRYDDCPFQKPEEDRNHGP